MEPDQQSAQASPLGGSADWRVGQVVDELYEVREELGEGGFGTVHKVFHRAWNLELAVKSLRVDCLGSRQAMESFVREANTWVGLGLHPHIVTCYFVRVLGEPRIFIEYMAGGSLADRLAAGEVRGLPDALDAAIQIARAMAYAHGRGLVHRDLKPGNCLVTPGGALKVTDFGLAKVGPEPDGGPEDGLSRGAKIARVEQATQTDQLGTPEYMAPEQWIDQRHAGPAADAWAFGAMLYELCLGRRLFVMAKDEPVVAFYERLLESNWSYWKPSGLPAAVAGLISACLSREPADRPVDFKGMAAVLEGAYEAVAAKAYPRQAVKEPPLLADTMVNQGVSMADLGRAEEALRLFGEALRLDPTHPGALYDQGVLLLDAGKLEAGELAVRLAECAKTRPQEWVPRYLTGLAQLLRGDAEAARGELAAASVMSHGNALVARAQRRLEAGSREGLEELFVALPRSIEAAAVEEGNFKSLMARARREFEQGKPAEACASAMKARGLKGYERSAEALGFLRRVGPQGARSRLLGGWQKGRFEGSEGALAVALPSGGGQVFSGHDGGVVKRWDPVTARCAGTETWGDRLKGQPRCLTPDGRFLLAGAGKALRVTEQESGRVVAELSGHGAEIAAVCLQPDGGVAYTAGADGVRVWELDWEYDFSAKPRNPPPAPAAPARRFRPSRRTVLIGVGVAFAAIVAGVIVWTEIDQRRAAQEAVPAMPAQPANPPAPAAAPESYELKGGSPIVPASQPSSDR